MSVVLGSIPGVYLGARISSPAPSGLIRALLALVLLASAPKLLEVSNTTAAWILGVGTTAGVAGSLVLRRGRHVAAPAEPVPTSAGRIR
ncbi:hypothetical protein [Nonomuraea rubra]|uniref:Uncharacterized protein n=1 Tax=Nonomuraea rubra TaxID=46180 RepID=A0A7X0U0M6_9ACTN|nr:hypothetical protein [Nonomuraea rubra]